MEDEPRRAGLGALIAAKVVCCGGLMLVATGALSLNAIGAWLQDGRLGWLVLAAVFVSASVWVCRRRRTIELELPTMAEVTRAAPGLERIDRRKAFDGGDDADKAALDRRSGTENL